MCEGVYRCDCDLDCVVTQRELQLLDGARLNNVQQVRDALTNHSVHVNTTNNVRHTLIRTLSLLLLLLLLL